MSQLAIDLVPLQPGWAFPFPGQCQHRPLTLSLVGEFFQVVACERQAPRLELEKAFHSSTYSRTQSFILGFLFWSHALAPGPHGNMLSKTSFLNFWKHLLSFCAEKISRTRRLVILNVTLTFSLPSGCHMTLLTKCFPSAYTGHRLLDTFLPDNVIFSFLRIVRWDKVPKSRISGKLYLLSRVF